jgi:hypothetical protein
MDEPITEMDAPEIRWCTVCGEAASCGYGPPGGSGAAHAWYCAGHREKGEQAWAARYRPTGGFGESLL